MVLACGFLIWGADNYRRLAERLQKEEDLRKLVVEELAHRLKNKIATIQSIISYQLREQPGLRNDIVARLVALSATDDLIIASHGRGASIRDILSTKNLGPMNCREYHWTDWIFFFPLLSRW
jgi:two-component sensor histidine kinase